MRDRNRDAHWCGICIESATISDNNRPFGVSTANDRKDVGHRISDPLFIRDTHNVNTRVSDESAISAKVHAPPPVDPPKGIQGYKSGWKSETPGRMYMYARNHVHLTGLCVYAYARARVCVHVRVYSHI